MAVFTNMMKSKLKIEMPYAIGRQYHSITESDYEVKVIRDIIAHYPEEKYDEIIKDCDSWWVFFHLSSLRKSIVGWYPFQKESTLLEVGAGFGALTSILCDRCGNVTAVESSPLKAEGLYLRCRQKDNLNVVLCQYDKLPKEIGKFDYILLDGTLDRIAEGSNQLDLYADYLKGLASDHLNEGGKILFFTQNRYGIRYFCGAREPHTGKPFDGLNKYPKGTSGYSFSRQEIIHILEKAELANYRFYYPLPDYEVAQLIYTDEYMKGDNISERATFYDAYQETLVAIERKMYNDIIDNSALPFLSNSFLIECGMSANLSDIMYAVISADRGAEFGLATTIHKNGSVCKRALYPAGRKNIHNIYQNAIDLKNKSVSVVEHRLEKNIIVTPFLKNDSLSVVLIKIIRQDKDKFEQLIDLWYEEILKSSDKLRESEIPPEFQNEQFGTILRKAYLDMVPVNCFVDGNKLLFFDQEFCMENVPAKFVLYRGLKYLYMSNSWMADILPMYFLLEKYEMDQIVEVLERIEEKFICQIRNKKVYRQFFEWSKLDRRNVISKRLLLDYQGEDITRFQLSESTKRQQKVQMDLLLQLKKVCEKHNIKYFLFYGSLIGCARHRGFIPWDDDVDVAMLREDYDKFCKAAQEEFDKPYFFQCPESESDFFIGGYGKLRNSDTTALQEREWGHSSNQGIWIDVFPLDKCYSDAENNKILRKKIREIQMIMLTKVYADVEVMGEISELEWQKYKESAQKYTWEQLCVKLREALMSCDEKESVYVAVLARMYNENELKVFYKEDFEYVELRDYEYLKLPVPQGMERCLEISKGTRYMNWPHEKFRKAHHKGLFSEYVPYKEYTNRFNINYERLKGRTLVVIGGGEVAARFVSEYGKGSGEVYLFVREGDYIKSCLKKIRRISLIELQNYAKYDINIIVCSKNFLGYEKILFDCNIQKYKIYIDDLALLNQRE